MLRPCRHRLPGDLQAAWTAHLCGLCLALRDGHGHAARFVTNTDAAAISALVEAQTGTGPGRRREAGPCALRGMRRASVAQGEAARLAATVSLTLAAATLEDHVADGDTGGRLIAAGARTAAGRAGRAGVAAGAELGFDAGAVLTTVRRQAEVERAATAGTTLLELTAPTEEATAAAFGHTAVLAGCSGNEAPLTDAGALFGRLAHLLDAVEDVAADRAAGRFNPVDHTGVSLAEVRALCDDAVLGIGLALQEATFDDGRLVHRLLLHETDHAVGRAFGATGPAVPVDGDPDPADSGPTDSEPTTSEPSPPDPPRDHWFAGCLRAVGLCCSGRLCCAKEFRGPWSRKRYEGFRRHCRDDRDLLDLCDGDCCW